MMPERPKSQWQDPVAARGRVLMKEVLRSPEKSTFKAQPIRDRDVTVPKWYQIKVRNDSMRKPVPVVSGENILGARTKHAHPRERRGLLESQLGVPESRILALRTPRPFSASHLNTDSYGQHEHMEPVTKAARTMSVSQQSDRAPSLGTSKVGHLSGTVVISDGSVATENDGRSKEVEMLPSVPSMANVSLPPLATTVFASVPAALKSPPTRAAYLSPMLRSSSVDQQLPQSHELKDISALTKSLDRDTFFNNLPQLPPDEPRYLDPTRKPMNWIEPIGETFSPRGVRLNQPIFLTSRSEGAEATQDEGTEAAEKSGDAPGEGEGEEEEEEEGSVPDPDLTTVDAEGYLADDAATDAGSVSTQPASESALIHEDRKWHLKYPAAFQAQPGGMYPAHLIEYEFTDKEKRSMEMRARQVAEEAQRREDLLNQKKEKQEAGQLWVEAARKLVYRWKEKTDEELAGYLRKLFQTKEMQGMVTTMLRDARDKNHDLNCMKSLKGRDPTRYCTEGTSTNVMLFTEVNSISMDADDLNRQIRARVRHFAAIKIQSWWRGVVVRKMAMQMALEYRVHLKKMLRLAIMVQSAYRGMKDRRRCRQMRERIMWAIAVIVKYMKGYRLKKGEQRRLAMLEYTRKRLRKCCKRAVMIRILYEEFNRIQRFRILHWPMHVMTREFYINRRAVQKTKLLMDVLDTYYLLHTFRAMKRFTKKEIKLRKNLIYFRKKHIHTAAEPVVTKWRKVAGLRARLNKLVGKAGGGRMVLGGNDGQLRLCREVFGVIRLYMDLCNLVQRRSIRLYPLKEPVIEVWENFDQDVESLKKDGQFAYITPAMKPMFAWAKEKDKVERDRIRVMFIIFVREAILRWWKVTRCQKFWRYVVHKGNRVSMRRCLQWHRQYAAWAKKNPLKAHPKPISEFEKKKILDKQWQQFCDKMTQDQLTMNESRVASMHRVLDMRLIQSERRSAALEARTLRQRRQQEHDFYLREQAEKKERELLKIAEGLAAMREKESAHAKFKAAQDAVKASQAFQTAMEESRRQKEEAALRYQQQTGMMSPQQGPVQSGQAAGDASAQGTMGDGGGAQGMGTTGVDTSSFNNPMGANADTAVGGAEADFANFHNAQVTAGIVPPGSAEEEERIKEEEENAKLKAESEKSVLQRLTGQMGEFASYKTSEKIMHYFKTWALPFKFRKFASKFNKERLRNWCRICVQLSKMERSIPAYRRARMLYSALSRWVRFIDGMYIYGTPGLRKSLDRRRELLYKLSDRIGRKEGPTGQTDMRGILLRWVEYAQRYRASGMVVDAMIRRRNARLLSQYFYYFKEDKYGPRRSIMRQPYQYRRDHIDLNLWFNLYYRRIALRSDKIRRANLFYRSRAMHFARRRPRVAQIIQKFKEDIEQRVKLEVSLLLNQIPEDPFTDGVWSEVLKYRQVEIFAARDYAIQMANHLRVHGADPFDNVFVCTGIAKWVFEAKAKQLLHVPKKPHKKARLPKTQLYKDNIKRIYIMAKEKLERAFIAVNLSQEESSEGGKKKKKKKRRVSSQEKDQLSKQEVTELAADEALEGIGDGPPDPESPEESIEGNLSPGVGASQTAETGPIRPSEDDEQRQYGVEGVGEAEGLVAPPRVPRVTITENEFVNMQPQPGSASQRRRLASLK